ncbi:family 3 encapsulin nanocompartment shell protein [Myxococcus sp. RHSTA-1-4]|uniref:family 3 encapsulin nanocompartment shell protein n=1 Tax=Myxococcus sp. RHSTA-1-4 TaxID=2874601 RepID=UPI001CBCAEF2|nr:family 3 encapsulin nanocompartment shell protein [Myxococcus sp. RHSTA-1-4]MBZ4414941.1 phage major capsid protein [Myxococcus sp. RHSTA-1-4]
MSTQSPAEPAPQSPGAVFAAAVAAQGTKARVQFSTTITEDFPGFKRRPRVAVRALFKVKTSDKPQARYWYETHPTTAPGAHVQDVSLRPEAAFEFHFDQQPLRPTTGWVQLPPNLLDDPEALAQFIDFRLLVRLCTAENQALTIGKGGERVRGLLETPGVTRLPARKDPVTSLLAACAEVEQMGGSADGILINSVDYYQHLLGQHGLLGELASMGIRICRTRMVTQGTVVVGDFTAGATLFDSGRSEIRFAEPPPGIFPREGLAIRGEIHEALAIHLPTHFFVAKL